MIALLSMALIAAAAPLEVAVLPLRGSAPELQRREASRVLIETLSALEGVRPISLEKIASVLGPEVDRALAACADDACLIRETQRIRSDRLVAGSLDVEGERTTLRLRLIDTSTASRGTVLVRVARDLARPDDLRAVRETAIELFPELASKSLGGLSITGAPDGATIYVDKKPVASSELRLKPGTYRIDVVAPGHRRWEGTAEVVVGESRTLEVDLVKNRSNTPYLLAGLGAVAGGVALVLGAGAASTADEWESACAGERCRAGFTRARYEADSSSVDRRRTSANGLLIVSGVALAASVVWYLLDPGSDEVER